MTENFIKNYVSKLAPVDVVNSVVYDCQDTLRNLTSVLPDVTELLGGALLDNDVVSDSLLTFMFDNKTIGFTNEGASFLLTTETDASGHEANCYLHYGTSTVAADGTVEDLADSVLILRTDDEGHVAYSIFDANGSADAKKFFTKFGYSVPSLLRNMLSSLDVSQIILDTMDAITTDASSALQVVTAKYAGLLDKISGPARTVYNSIVSCLSLTSCGVSAVIQYVVDIYKSYRSAALVGQYGITFNDKKYYVQGFFESVRISNVITTLAQVAGTVMVAIGAPVIQIIGAAASITGAVASRFFNTVTESTATIDANALNNMFAIPIAQDRVVLQSPIEGNDPQLIGIYDMVSRYQVITLTFPSLYVIAWRDVTTEGNEVLCFEAYVRFDYAPSDRASARLTPLCNTGNGGIYTIGGTFDGVGHFTNLAPTSIALYSVSDNQATLAGWNSVKALLEGLSSTQDSDTLINNNAWLNSIAFSDEAPGRASVATDAQILTSLMMNICVAMCFISSAVPSAAGLSPAVVQKALSKNNVYSYEALDDIVGVVERMRDLMIAPGSTIFEVTGALICLMGAINALKTAVQDGEPVYTFAMITGLIRKVFPWETIVNTLFPKVRKTIDRTNSLSKLCCLFYTYDENDPALDGWFSCNKTKTTSSMTVISPIFTTASLPDRDHPFITPPAYSKYAFLRTILISAGVVAAGVLTAVGVLKVIRAIQFRIQRKYQEVERVRYEYQSNPTDENWRAYVKTSKSYNRFARLVGATRVSYLTGWDVEAQASNFSTEDILQEINSSSPAVSNDNIVKLIRGIL